MNVKTVMIVIIAFIAGVLAAFLYEPADRDFAFTSAADASESIVQSVSTISNEESVVSSDASYTSIRHSSASSSSSSSSQEYEEDHEEDHEYGADRNNSRYFVDNNDPSRGSSSRNNLVRDSSLQNSARINPEAEGCTGTGPVTFTNLPRRIGDIGVFMPMGMMISEHVTPIDHAYFYPSLWKREPTLADLTDVIAPADGVITSIGRMPTFFSNKNPEFEDYRIIIYHTCTFYTIYIHVYKLAPAIKAVVGELAPSQTIYPAIPIKAGDLIGRANAFDFSVHDDETVLPGFVVPEHYEGERWKVHTVDPFDYFEEPLRTQLLSKNIRVVEPYGGKIDQDIDGTLQGNWFIENTNGYQGIQRPEYWVTHASFSPDMIDESVFIVSLGDYGGKARQFATKTNSPLPRSVDTTKGVVKYELVDIEYTIGNGDRYWDRISLARDIHARPGSTIQGVILVEMLDKRKMKMELFAGKTAVQVSGFTAAAKMYER